MDDFASCAQAPRCYEQLKFEDDMNDSWYEPMTLNAMNSLGLCMK